MIGIYYEFKILYLKRNISLAVQFGHLEIVKLLLEQSSDFSYFEKLLKCSNLDQMTPLMQGKNEAYLLKKWISKNSDCNTNCLACEYGHFDIVGLLLQKAADFDLLKNSINAFNKDGSTSLMLGNDTSEWIN